MDNLGEFLRAMHSDDHEKKSTILPEAAIERLKEAAVRYAAMLDRPMFEIGDLVTPRKDTNMKGAGDPHVVVDARRGDPIFNDEPSSHVYGYRPNIRVMTLVGDVVACFWCESWQYERYVAG